MYVQMPHHRSSISSSRGFYFPRRVDDEYFEDGVCMCVVVVVVVVIVVIIVVVPPQFGFYVYLCPPRSYPNLYISGEILWFPPPKRCVCVHVCVCFYVPNNDDARRKIPTDAKAHTKEKMNRFFLKTPPLSIVQ